MSDLKKAAEWAYQCMTRMLEDGEWYNAEMCVDNLYYALEQHSEQEAPETHDHLHSFAEDWDAPGMEAYDDLPLASPEPFGWLYESKAGVRIFHPASDDKRFQADWEVAQQHPEAHKMTPLYAHPPQRKPLTDEEIDAACGPCDDSDLARGFRREFIKRFRVIYERLHGIGVE